MPKNKHKQKRKERAVKGTAQENRMDFFASAVGVLQKLVIGLGAGLGVWGGINLMEGYRLLISSRRISSFIVS